MEVTTNKTDINVLALLQARTTSTRLPNKVLLPILGEPMILRQIERLQRATLIDQLTVVTSTEESDNKLAALCAENNISCFRGSLNDVLDRFYQAASLTKPLHVVRLTADCPLTDPELIDQIIQYYLKGEYDYVSNAIEPTFPDGLDMEIFRYKCLEIAWKEAGLSSQREHVTPYIYQQCKRFKIGHYKGKEDLSQLRWTVDEPKDFALIEQIYSSLYPSNPAFTTEDILNLLKQNIELQTINTDIVRNEGLLKSLQQDTAFNKK
jgi:spore coat polysaccharide biosynthesis protein SpsF